MKRHICTWVSDDTTGAVSGTVSAVNGILWKVTFKPDSGGTQPSNLYDVTLNDAYSVDTLAGQGANLANNANTSVVPGVPMKDGTTTSTHPCAIDGDLTLAVTNAGNSKGGVVVLYVR